ncbi:uncharacterized protein RAG0_15169 [Rhynchosporium agropyri]|uniref:Uncharacterized protein n=1 Tax=Rhynchosporium agropyri TaxID=914238 RepID=A0A1E1LJX7_9HELO|nr:uncharacterized protein RAG0_15169 [Rhynchosporium agropyri]
MSINSPLPELPTPPIPAQPQDCLRLSQRLNWPATAQFGTLGSALVVEKTVRSGTMSEGLAPGGDKKWTPAPHRSEGVEKSHALFLNMRPSNSSEFHSVTAQSPHQDPMSRTSTKHQRLAVSFNKSYSGLRSAHSRKMEHLLGGIWLWYGLKCQKELREGGLRQQFPRGRLVENIRVPCSRTKAVLDEREDNTNLRVNAASIFLNGGQRPPWLDDHEQMDFVAKGYASRSGSNDV